MPDSGTGWLDDMIREGLRDELAAKAMQGRISAGASLRGWTPKEVAEESYKAAEAMLSERNKGE